MQRIKEEHELAECTFKPKLLNNDFDHYSEPSHGDRNLDLYSKVKLG